MAEPRGSWPCRRRGPGAWPPVERRPDGACEAAGVQPHAEPPSCPWLSGDHCPLQVLTWARILRAGPSFSPMVVRRCSSVSRGRVSPSIPCSLKTWGGRGGAVSGPECWGCVLGWPRLSRESRAKRSWWCNLGKMSEERKLSSVGHVPMLEADMLTRGGRRLHQYLPPPVFEKSGVGSTAGEWGGSEPSWAGGPSPVHILHSQTGPPQSCRRRPLSTC